MSRVWKVGRIHRQVEMSKQVKPWGFTTESVQLALSVRYGTKVLELAKGKVTLEAGNLTQRSVCSG